MVSAHASRLLQEMQGAVLDTVGYSGKGYEEPALGELRFGGGVISLISYHKLLREVL